MPDYADPGDVSRHHVDKNTSSTIPYPFNPQVPAVDLNPLENIRELDSLPKPSTLQDGDQGKAWPSSRVRVQSGQSVGDWADSPKSGPGTDLPSSDFHEDYVRVEQFDNIGTSDAPRRPLPRHPGDTGSNASHGKGDHSGDISCATAVAAGDCNQNAKADLEPYAERAWVEMRQTADHFDSEWQRLKQTIHRYENEFSILHRELQHAVNLVSIRDKELVGAQQRLEEATQKHENELSNLRTELQDAQSLASALGKRLVVAEAFLTADTLSVSEVISKVIDLNEEIYQAAALLSETLVRIPHDISEEEENHALGVAQGLIGGKIINILREQSRKGVSEASPLIVQVVFQVFLVTYCSQLVQSWSNDTIYSDYLTAAYTRIRDVEGQEVSCRWRSFTRKHTRPTTDGWKEDLVRKFRNVLRVASLSWTAPSVERRNAFERKLEPIFRAVEDLRIALGEKFVSADLEVSVMEPDQAFQPAYMEDAYGDSNQRRASQEVVVGTTGIGLKKVMLQSSAKREVMYEIVLSPKVALESTLLQALQPQSPRHRRRKTLEAPRQLPKRAAGAGTPKLSSSTFTAAGVVPSSLQPPAAPPKTGQTAVRFVQQQQQQPEGQNPQRDTRDRSRDEREIGGALLHIWEY